MNLIPPHFKSNRSLFFLTSGVLLCVLFFFLTMDYYISLPIFKYPTDQQRNVTRNSSWRNDTLRKNIMNIVEKVKSLSLRNSKIHAPNRNVEKCTDSFRRNHLMRIPEAGRTGNKLFQFATLIATAESSCYTAVRTSRTIKHFDEVFNLKNVEKRMFDLTSFKVLDEPGWSIFVKNMTSLILPEFNWTIGGYRQSYRYFQNHSKLVKSSFEFKENIKSDVVSYLENETRVYKGPSVCLHVRRGDMTKRGLSSVSFINNALSFFKKRLSPLNFSLVVISDDIIWCKANIKKSYTYYSPFKDVGRDFFLLTQCNHNIITVGSFGWFGAWLNETGIVVYDKTYPMTQFKVGHKHEDYYPSHWIGL